MTKGYRQSSANTSSVIVTVAGFGCITLFMAASLNFGIPFVAAGFLGLMVLAICNLSAKLSLVAFLCAICLVPYWWGLDIVGYLPVAALVAIAVLPGALVRGIKSGNHVLTAILLLSALVAMLLVSGASMPGHGFVFLAQWLPAFLVGYALTQQAGLQFVRDAVTVIFVAIAVFAIIEYVTSWNPYAGTAPTTQQYLKIGALQDRGGVTRSEGAFAQSIALANSLALAIPMVLTSRFRAWTQAISLALIVIAIFTTFSRSGLVTAALAFAFMFLASRDQVSRRMRSTVAIVVAATAVVALPWVEGVFAAASSETARSAGHRLRLLELLPNLNAFGTATGYHEVGGVFEWFGVISIDNAFLRLAVNFGWVFGVLCLIAATWVFVRAAQRRASAPEIALASVMPALLTVALITQFGILVWFYAGVAAAVAARLTLNPDPQIDPVLSENRFASEPKGKA